MLLDILWGELSCKMIWIISVWGWTEVSVLGNLAVVNSLLLSIAAWIPGAARWLISSPVSAANSQGEIVSQQNLYLLRLSNSSKKKKLETLDFHLISVFQVWFSKCPCSCFMAEYFPWQHFWIPDTESQETYCQRTHFGRGCRLYGAISPLLLLLCSHILVYEAMHIMIGFMYIGWILMFYPWTLSESQRNELKTGDNMVITG